MKFSDHLWQSIHSIYSATLQHPFIQELHQGTLAQATFHYYLQQDALYLIDFARALAITATKADESEDFIQCLAFAEGAMVAELNLHQQIFHQYGIEPQAEKSLSCLAYTQFLLATASQASFAEAMAALLPCFWIYREIGCYLQKNSVPANPYCAWIATYSGPQFNASVEKAIALTDKAAAQVSKSTLQKMQHLFSTSAKLEWLFWDEAYKSSAVCSQVFIPELN